MKKLDLPRHASSEPLCVRLRAWRNSHRGWTQAMAAEHLGVSERTYENWEAGTNEPRGIGRHALEKRIKTGANGRYI